MLKLEIGAEFATFADFEKWLQTYSEQEKQVFVKKDSRLLKESDHSFTKLKYRQLVYKCKFGGIHTSQSSGLRSSKTYQRECPAMIRLGVTKNMEKLIIKNFCDNHENHHGTEEFYRYIPENRRLTVEKEQTLHLLEMKSKKKMIQAKLAESNKVVSMKDLHNLDRQRRKIDDDTLSAAVKLLRETHVAAGFPTGQYPLASRLAEIEYAVSLGVDEIDIVIDRSLVLAHKWEELFMELVEMRKACGSACMKTILAVGELPSLGDIYKASMLAMYAGSNFIKTSTGKEMVNATLPIGIVMCRAIKDYYRQTAIKIGFKPAGGIKTSVEALQWLVLVKEELGHAWLVKNLFRIGASSLLDDIVKAIESEPNRNRDLY